MTAKKIFAQRLLSIREEKNITRQKAADDLEITRASLEFYEKGKRTPDINIIVKIASYYGVSTDYLLGVTDTKAVDDKIKIACEVTGLNEKHIEILQLAFVERELANELENIRGAAILTYLDAINALFDSLEKYPEPLSNLLDIIEFLNDKNNKTKKDIFIIPDDIKETVENYNKQNENKLMLLSEDIYGEIIEQKTRDSFETLFYEIKYKNSGGKSPNPFLTDKANMLKARIELNIDIFNQEIQDKPTINEGDNNGEH